ncbi:HAD-IIA family hydrolase [Alloscardovia criceti]|uniref:HAD-IIA family hydrolase n=1 Tax=Alloscardovia criceti TaxID=356828 RepID=UPI00036D03FB|nr:HAD-IIA family hydrolase [Alloscardovia criceti]
MTKYPVKIKGSATPLAQRYTLALLDLDGVVYRGANPVDNAASGIAQAAEQGMRIAYTTNNPSRFPDVVAEQISSFGVDAHGTDVITSAMVSSVMLAEKLPQGASVLVIGKDHLRDEIEKVGLTVVDKAADKPDAIIQSWYPEIGWAQLAEACYAIENGAQYYVTNRDLTLPREQGIAPGTGALQLAVIKTTGQEPLDSAGKPEAAMYHQARHLFSPTEHMVETENCLPVGDRLDTDIEAANRGGYDSAVVLTGVADAQQIITAEPILRPTYICVDLLGLSTPQPQVEVSDAQATCDNARAWMDGSQLRIEVDGAEQTDNISSLNALRAAASVAWAAVDRGNIRAGDIQLPHFAAQFVEDFRAEFTK